MRNSPNNSAKDPSSRSLVTQVYYFIKPVIPRRVQLFLRHKIANKKRKQCQQIWPIDERASSPPAHWNGWPQHKRFALVLTHDVETAAGLEKIDDLIHLERQFGFRSAFYFVPERYKTDKRKLAQLAGDGFEVGVHGLKHDGKLFKDYRTFSERSVKINEYLQDWNSQGFRAPAMQHNLDWLHALEIQYDASTFDTDPFEPQPDGMATIFPFIVRKESLQHTYVELPYTLPQDCTLFLILKEKNIAVWKRKLDWLVSAGGMALVDTHPDYMNFDGRKLKPDEYPASFYAELLQYISDHYRNQYWHILPKELAGYWMSRGQQDVRLH